MIEWLFWLVVAIIVAKAFIVIVRPYEVALVERLGKFDRILKSGIHFVIPLIERVIPVDLREKVVDIPEQEVICKDNVVVTVDGIVYYQIVDPKKAIYNVADYLVAIIQLAQTSLRSIIGEMELDETLSNREKINVRLREEIDHTTDKWGIKITRVEIKRIDPPRDIQDAMAMQMKAEREKRAMILEAEGKKTSAILVAEGQKQSQILKAEGEAQATKLKAEAQAKAIEYVVGALKDADKKFLTLRYLEYLPEVAKSSNTVLLPYEASEFISSLKGLSEVLSSKKRSKQ